MEVKTFGSLLSERIAQLDYDGEKITPTTLALLLKLNRSTVHKWKYDLFTPDDKHMVHLSRLLGWEADSDVWLSLKRLPPPILDFLCDTDEGRHTFAQVQRVYRAWSRYNGIS